MTAAPVVVLGACGFIGRHVCRSLSKQGFTVYGIGHGRWSEDERATWGVTRWREADINLESLSALVGDEVPRALLHCAGTGAVSHSYRAPFEDFERSVATTATVLEFARIRCGGAVRVVLASSAAVYGDQGDVDLPETATRAPVSPYGFSKVAAESLCDSYSRFFGISSSVVRLFSVYGEGLRKQLLWDAMLKFSKGEARFFGTGHELRDWIHVDDAANLLAIAALAPQAPFEIYNGGHVHATTKDVLTQLATLSGRMIAPSFTSETHVGNPRRLTANCGHAERQLAWRPGVSLRTGLARYAQWFNSVSET